eukprot:COSAG01_NODE_63339_length_280_cov_0.867403_1_plen_77_part_10
MRACGGRLRLLRLWAAWLRAPACLPYHPTQQQSQPAASAVVSPAGRKQQESFRQLLVPEPERQSDAAAVRRVTRTPA